MAHHTAFQKDRIPLAIEPLDPLFFRDGRPFGAGNHRGISGLPTPRTLSGMLRWQLIERTGADPAEFKHEDRDKRHWLARLAVRGPWLATLEPGGAAVSDVYTAPPAHLMRRGKGEHGPLALLAPLGPSVTLPGWNQPNPYDGQPPLAPPWDGWQTEPLTPLAGRLLNRAGLARVLAGQTPDDKDHVVKHASLFTFEDRVGVGIDPATQTGADGLLYSLRLIRLQEHTGFYAEVGIEDDDEKAVENLRALLRPGSGFIAPFGGEGRRVAVRVLEKPFEWPSAPADAIAPEDGGFTSLLVTPACFAPRDPAVSTGRQFPPHPLGTLAAAALGRPAVESGWHLGGGGRAGRAAGVARPTRLLVPAGSTYFWRRGRNAREETGAPATWHQLAQTPVDRAAGYGLALRGVWQWWSARG
ncbi:MAG: CRISPR-associated protein Cmr3 [Candidatus Sumerlaeota bacterium]|nr:CRISPR-associated protein Cmr3 [Candidatus Sumerlaeota bacterium]